MTKVLSELDLRALPDGRWQVLKPFKVRLDALDERVVAVPIGFVTDLASVPRVPFVYWTVGGRAKRAAVIHDYLYQCHFVSRLLADQAFYEIALVEEGKAVATAMWLGIRAFGWAAYRSGPRRFTRFENTQCERRCRLRGM